MNFIARIIFATFFTCSAWCMSSLETTMAHIKKLPDELQYAIRDHYCTTEPRIVCSDVTTVHAGKRLVLLGLQQLYHYAIYDTATQRTTPWPEQLCTERPFYVPVVAGNWVYTITKNKLTLPDRTKKIAPYITAPEEYLLRIFEVTPTEIVPARSFPLSKKALPTHYRQANKFLSPHEHFLLIPNSFGTAKLIQLGQSIEEIATISMQPKDSVTWGKNDTTFTITTPIIPHPYMPLTTRYRTTHTINCPPPTIQSAEKIQLTHNQQILNGHRVGSQILYQKGTTYWMRPALVYVKAIAHAKKYDYTLEQLLLIETVLHKSISVNPEKLQAEPTFATLHPDHQQWLLAAVKKARCDASSLIKAIHKNKLKKPLK